MDTNWTPRRCTQFLWLYGLTHNPDVQRKRTPRALDILRSVMAASPCQTFISFSLYNINVGCNLIRKTMLIFLALEKTEHVYPIININWTSMMWKKLAWAIRLQCRRSSLCPKAERQLIHDVYKLQICCQPGSPPYPAPHQYSPLQALSKYSLYRLGGWSPLCLFPLTNGFSFQRSSQLWAKVPRNRTS